MNEITESRKPPVATTGILGWLRMNLFSNWVNSIITLFVLYIFTGFYIFSFGGRIGSPCCYPRLVVNMALHAPNHGSSNSRPFPRTVSVIGAPAHLNYLPTKGGWHDP